MSTKKEQAFVVARTPQGAILVIPEAEARKYLAPKEHLKSLVGLFERDVQGQETWVSFDQRGVMCLHYADGKKAYIAAIGSPD